MARRRGRGALQRLQDDSAYSKKAVERLDWTYYDTAVLAVGTLEHRFFTVPLGQAGKTLRDTNMISSGQLPQGQNFKIHAIKVFFRTLAALATVDVQFYYDLLFDTTVEVIIPGKDSMGTWLLGELFGMCQAAAVIPTTAGDNLDLNMPTFKGVFPLNYPLKIGGVQSFELRVRHQVAVNTALDDDRLTIALQGRLFRMS